MTDFHSKQKPYNTGVAVRVLMTHKLSNISMPALNDILAETYNDVYDCMATHDKLRTYKEKNNGNTKWVICISDLTISQLES